MKPNYSDLPSIVFRDGADAHIPASKLLDIIRNRITLHLTQLVDPQKDLSRTQLLRGGFLELQQLEKALMDLNAEVDRPELNPEPKRS